MSDDQAGGGLVTAIIASYNHREYIESAIKSLATQDYKNLEIIVIDDGSSDGSAEILEKLKEKYTFRLVHKPNGGVVSVINLGISLAAGEYVLFHASDDESMSYRVSQQVAVLSKFKDAAFVSSNLEFQRQSGELAGTLRAIDDTDKVFTFEDLFLCRAGVSSVSSMYRLSHLKAMGGLDTRHIAEDPQIFWRVTSGGATWVQSSRAPVIRYRMIFSSQSRTRMPTLCRQLTDLVEEFSWHAGYRQARSLAWGSFFAAVAEVDRRQALKIAFGGKINIFSGAAARGIAKILLPRPLHGFFKRAGRS